ncbi:clytin-like [Clytia hemisphaerica]|uniref:EF-hand domain-containing protein n=1 Tax=Clytia hemisphaerica TaxID=252671 RepID=A0A7M5WYW6_9CNID|eukprot:TCONS_00012676-protein
MAHQETGSKYAVKLKPDFNNPKWINRHRFMFNFLDINGNGKITLDEIVSKASDDICAKLNASPEQTQRHQDAVEAFFKAIGMDYGKEVEFPEFLEGWKRLATNDLKLWSQNKTTLIRRWGDVVFDIFDKDGSGTISLDEWKAYGRVSGICASDADAEETFKHCDLDNSGKLDVDEMTRQHLGFWYTLDPQADGLYGSFVP